MRAAMPWLNYHHLRYFWAVAREGGIAKAAQTLHASQPTISAQVRQLQDALGEKLFERAGRGLALTEMGRVVYRYAEEIFLLGRELVDTVQGRPTGRPAQLAVGVADVVPKMVAYRLLEPTRRLADPVTIVCIEDKPDRLAAQLATHELHVMITDAPLNPSLKIRAYSHLIGECGVTFFGTASLVKRYRRDFPQSLDGAPTLLPTSNTVLRRSLDEWFDRVGVRPASAGEFEDSALLKAFGHAGVGVFPAASAIEAQVRGQYRVGVVGRTHAIRERFYVVSAERRITHPAVTAIVTAARTGLFSR